MADTGIQVPSGNSRGAVACAGILVRGVNI